MRLNKMAALRCGKCDTLWHRCIDHTCVHGGQQDYAEEWTHYRQLSRARSASHHSSASGGQPRGKNPKGKKTRQKKNKNLAPDLDPPWTSKKQCTSTSTTRSAHGLDVCIRSVCAGIGCSSSRRRMCAVLQSTEAGFRRTKTSNHQQGHACCGGKAGPSSQSLSGGTESQEESPDNSWSTYIDESIKRWKSFVADFGKKDQDLEERVEKSKESLQMARENLDKVKEMLSKQDAESLGVETISDGEGDEEITKMD